MGVSVVKLLRDIVTNKEALVLIGMCTISAGIIFSLGICIAQRIIYG